MQGNRAGADSRVITGDVPVLACWRKPAHIKRPRKLFLVRDRAGAVAIPCRNYEQFQEYGGAKPSAIYWQAGGANP